MVGERDDIALQDLDARLVLLHLLVLARLVLDRLHEGNRTADGHEALAHLGDEVALLADILDQLLQIDALARILLVHARQRALGAEGLLRGVVDDLSGALQVVGGAVDHGFEQRDEDTPAIHRGGLRLHRPLHIGREGLRVMIPHGNERLVLDDEGDRG